MKLTRLGFQTENVQPQQRLMNLSNFKKLYIWKEIVVIAKAKLAMLKYDMFLTREILERKCDIIIAIKNREQRTGVVFTSFLSLHIY
jgi:hypothetical protein